MKNEFELFPCAKPSESGAPSSESLDAGPFAWWPMHDLRKRAFEIDSPSGRTVIADICRLVARALVHSRYAEPGEAGAFRAISTDAALRRAVDLLDLASELKGRLQQEPSGDE